MKLLNRTSLSLIVLACVAWVLFYPPGLLAKRIKDATDGRLQLLDSTGTIWNGQAQLGLSDGGRLYALPSPLHWSVFFFQNDLTFGIELKHPSMIQPVKLGVGLKGFQVKGGQMLLPASWLSSLGAPFNTIKPEGQLRVQWQAFSPGANFQLNIRWADAQSALASIRPLGQYEITLKGDPDSQLNLNIKTNKGPLFITGHGKLEPGKRMMFDGYAYSDESSKAALTGLLSQMGRLEGGKYRLGVF